MERFQNATDERMNTNKEKQWPKGDGKKRFLDCELVFLVHGCHQAIQQIRAHGPDQEVHQDFFHTPKNATIDYLLPL